MSNDSDYRDSSAAMGLLSFWWVFLIAIGVLTALFFVWIQPTFIKGEGKAKVVQEQVNNDVLDNSRGHVATVKSEMAKDYRAYLDSETYISDHLAAGATEASPDIASRRSQQAYHLHQLRTAADQTPSAVTSDIRAFLDQHKNDR